MFCAISGEACQEPVVSKTGYIFEKRLILKHLEEDTACPVTGTQISADDLFAVHDAPNKPSHFIARPRLSNNTSIPALLQTFQDEWDAIVAESHTLQGQNLKLRQELARSLYEQDAATRVIGRLLKERDEAHEMLRSFKAEPMTGANGQLAETIKAEAPQHQDSKGLEPMVVDENQVLPDSLMHNIVELSKNLAKSRKKRKAPEDLTQAEDFQSDRFTLGKKGFEAHPAKHGSSCIHGLKTRPLLMSGGSDGTTVIWDYRSQTSRTIETQNGPIRAVAAIEKSFDQMVPNYYSFDPSTGRSQEPSNDVVYITASDEGIKLWNEVVAEDSMSFEVAGTISDHDDTISSLDVHASYTLLLSSQTNGQWLVHDIETCKRMYKSQKDADGISKIGFHPDGVLIGAGGAQKGHVNLFDLRTGSKMVTCEHDGEDITSLDFSQNGFLVSATASGSSVVKIWDLRKGGAVIGEIDVKDCVTTSAKRSTKSPKRTTTRVGCARFDDYSKYMAVGCGNRICLFKNRTWDFIMETPAIFTPTTHHVTDLAWCPSSCGLVASSANDRHLKLWSSLPAPN